MKTKHLVPVLAVLVLLLLACASGRFIGKCEVVQYALGVYWDHECNIPVVEVDWGSLQLGESKNASFYIRNEGSVNATGLMLTAKNWNPSAAEEYLSLTWDYSGLLLEPSEVENVTLTLQVNESTPISAFVFEIAISANWSSPVPPPSASLVTSVVIPSAGTVANPVAEFPSLFVLPLLMFATLMAVMLINRKNTEQKVSALA